MKMKNISKLTLATLMAFQMVNADVANANVGKKVIEILKTSKKEGLSDPYFQLKSMNIRELTAEESLEFENSNNIISKGFTGPNIPNIPPVPPSNGDVVVGTNDGPAPATRGALDSVIMVIDKLIAIGQKIIPTIKEGKAVVTNSPMTAVSVLPRFDSKDPAVHEMGGWTIPVSKHYKISYSNGFGSEVVSFVYSISYQYNGNVDGKGKYLAGIRASATNIDVSWGFDLDASSQLIQISNVGTQKDVIAGATIEMSYTVKNWTRTLTTSESFFVSGDGKLYKMD